MKKSFKPLVFISFLLIFALLWSGCAKNIDQTKMENSTTHIVTDSIGRQVSIPREIKKAAVLDAFITESIVMTQGGNQIVSCPAGTQKNLLLQQICPELSDKPSVTNSGVVNAEALMALDPDVLLIKWEFYQNQAEADKIEKLGIPYIVIRYKTMADQLTSLRIIADVMGNNVKENMEILCQEYEKVIALSEELRQKIPQNSRIKVYHSITEAVRTDGTNSLGADWIPAVGAINVSLGQDTRAEGDDYYCTMEQIFIWDPDVIICNDATTAEYFKTNPKFSGLRAVSQNKIYNIPIGFTRWGHQGSSETFFGMLWLGTTIYPEVYKNIDLKTEITHFYKKVSGIEIDDTLWEKILSGYGIRNSGKNSGK